MINEKNKRKIVFREEFEFNLKKLLEKSIDSFKNVEIEIILNIINEILLYEEIKICTFFLEFVGISQYGLDLLSEGNVTKEGYIYKKTTNKRHSCCASLFTCYLIKFCNFWNKRWFILQDDMICYLESSQSNIGRDVSINNFYFIDIK